MTTITTGMGRNGSTYWAVRSGPGETRLAICQSAAEAESVAAQGCDGVAGGCERCDWAFRLFFGAEYHVGGGPNIHRPAA
jgi:hypothetical protein